MDTSPLPTVFALSIILFLANTYSASPEYPPSSAHRLLSYLPLSSLFTKRDQGNPSNDGQINGPGVPPEGAEEDRALLSVPVPGGLFLSGGLEHQPFPSEDSSLQRFFLETWHRLLDGRSGRIRRQDSTQETDDGDAGSSYDYEYYGGSVSGQSGDGTEYYYSYEDTTTAPSDYGSATDPTEEQGGNPDETTESQSSSLATIATTAATAAVTVKTTRATASTSATPVDSDADNATKSSVTVGNGIVFIPVTFPPGLVTSRPPKNGVVVSVQSDPDLFIPPGVQMSVSPTGEVTFQIPDGLKWKDIKNTFTDKNDKRFWRKIFQTVKKLRKENSDNGGFTPVAGESSFQIPAEVTYDAVVKVSSGMSLKQLILLRHELQELRFLSKRSQTSMKIYVQGGLTDPPPGVTVVSASSGGQVVEIPNILRWRDVRDVIEDPVQKSLWKQVFASRDANIRLLQGDIYELVRSIDYVQQLIREKRWQKRQNQLKKKKKKHVPRNGKTLLKKKKKKSKRKQNMSKKEKKEKRKKRRQNKRKKRRKEKQEKINSKKTGKNSPKPSREGRNWRKDMEKEKQNKGTQKKKKGEKKNKKDRKKGSKRGSKKKKSNDEESNKQDDIFKSLIPSNSNLAGGTISFNPILLTTDNKGNGDSGGKKGKSDKSHENKSILDILLQKSEGNSHGRPTEEDDLSKNFGTNFWEKKKENSNQDLGNGDSFFSSFDLSNPKNHENSSKKKQKSGKDKRKKDKERKNNKNKQNNKNKEKNSWLFAY